MLEGGWERASANAGETPAARYRLRREYSYKLGADLVQSAAVGFAFLMEDGGDFRRGLHVGFRLLLYFDVDHFFQ
jgi:hypothetical protein